MFFISARARKKIAVLGMLTNAHKDQQVFLSLLFFVVVVVVQWFVCFFNMLLFFPWSCPFSINPWLSFNLP